MTRFQLDQRPWSDGEAGIVEALADTFRQNHSDSREFFHAHQRCIPERAPSADLESSEADIVKDAVIDGISVLVQSKPNQGAACFRI